MDTTVDTETELSPRRQGADLAEHITATVGPVTAWSLVVTTTDGREHLVYPPGQDPRLTHDMHLDAAHGLDCSGCASCARISA